MQPTIFNYSIKPEKFITMSAAKYRPEIDGLRAIAILLVIIYHASFTIDGISILPGGYIGVDVFFVISGYLISRILLAEMKKGTFSFVKFYERRARRILPALIIITAVTSVFAWHILMPDALLEFGQSLLATALFSANIYFLKLDSYTAELIAHKPLLHMWSLGIEEQFYIFFPPLLLLVYKKFTRYLPGFLALLFLTSLVLAQYCSTHFPGANFYLAPSRVWELVGGGILASLESRQVRGTQSLLSQFLPQLGLLAILCFALFADDSLRHPSLFTLAPVLGTMALIWQRDSQNIIIKLLTYKPVVWTGLISYSLYLWHQPVFALTRIQLNRELLNFEKTALLAGCFFLAFITYFLVEKPTRNRIRTSSRTIWTAGALGSLALAVFGLVVHFGNGFPTRYFAAKLMSEAMYGRYAPDSGSLECKNFDPEAGNCQFSGPAANGYTLLTVGDSHIRTLDAPIVEHLETMSFVSKFIPLNSGTSFFTFDLDIVLADGNKQEALGLTGYNRIRYEKILASQNPLIITGGRLPIYLENERFNNLEGGVEPGGQTFFIKPPENTVNRLSLDDIAASYKATITALLDQGVKVVLIYPVPEVGWNVIKQVSELIENNSGSQVDYILQTFPITTSFQVFKQRTARAYQVYDSIGEHHNLLRIYPEKLLCHDTRCHTHNSEALYYRDDNHLSFYGASMLLEHMLEKMQDKWKEL